MLAFTGSASAQQLSYGFKTGLNFNRIKGDVETDANGQALEKLERETGFHFGATVAWNITDLMGLRGEFLYNQKGTERSFKGPSYYNFFTSDNEIVRTTGTRNQNLNVNNAYIDIPILFYYKPFQRFEIYGGGSVGFLVASTALGQITYSGISDSGSPVAEIKHQLDFNYLSDKPMEAIYDDPASTVKIKGEDIPYPQSAGAYFEFVEGRGKLYKTVDFAVLAGLSAYLSKSLYLSGRINYGLSDITKSKADVSLSTLDSGEFISRDDDDRNLSLQVSLGFSF